MCHYRVVLVNSIYQAHRAQLTCVIQSHVIILSFHINGSRPSKLYSHKPISTFTSYSRLQKPSWHQNCNSRVDASANLFATRSLFQHTTILPTTLWDAFANAPNV